MASEAVRAWASEWADEFDQNWDQEGVHKYVGKTITAIREREGEEPRGFRSKKVVGFSHIVLCVNPEDGSEEEEQVHRWGFVLDDGTMVSILSEMKITEEVSDE